MHHANIHRKRLVTKPMHQDITWPQQRAVWSFLNLHPQVEVATEVRQPTREKRPFRKVCKNISKNMQPHSQQCKKAQNAIFLIKNAFAYSSSEANVSAARFKNIQNLPSMYKCSKSKEWGVVGFTFLYVSSRWRRHSTTAAVSSSSKKGRAAQALCTRARASVTVWGSSHCTTHQGIFLNGLHTR